MPRASDVRSAIDRDDVAVALVEEVITDHFQRQQAAAAAVVKHWESTEWPEGLVAQSLFTSTNGKSLLTYAQWSAATALRQSLQQSPNGLRPDWAALGVEPGAPKAYELYRVVRPAVPPDPLPFAQSFPAAVFLMPSQEAARRWVDELLENEEKNEGAARDYPGALAANFHVAADGTGIFLLSEWASEEEVVVHIKEVIEPLLEQMGQAETGPGSLYSFYATVSAT